MTESSEKFINDVGKLILFRRNMGVSTTVKELVNIFSRGKLIKSKILLKNKEGRLFINPKFPFSRYIIRSHRNSEIYRKFQFVYRKRALFFLFGLVKYIGITGSVAANNAKIDDDIDIFVVVKNGCSWIYRGLLLLILLPYIRLVNLTQTKNKLCINIITEERDLKFERDLFTFHELYFMKTIYNRGYKHYILRQNKWVQDYSGYIPERINYIPRKSNIFIQILNVLFFWMQLLFMIFTLHKPDFARIFRNNRKGRIEFYPKEFKREILTKFDSLNLD